MITQPDAAMLDSKLFVSRLDDPFPDLYERFWDGVEWIWVNHGRPEGVRMKTAPGAAMMNEKLFVVVDDGRLFERHWRSDLGRWAWQDHGRPENRPIVHAPGAAMMNEKLFVVVDDGRLFERHWRGDLGRWAWNDHGRPADQKIIAAPGAAMNDEKLFVAVEDGRLFERHWRGDLGRWAWNDHGRPADRRVVAAPGAAMMNEKLFVTVDDGRVFERHWRGDLGRWAWHDHGRPPGTDARTAPGAAMMASKFFIGTADAHLFERMFNGTEWVWVDHGTAFHDQSQHVIGAPGSDPKLTVAIMGDGYAEADMDAYRRVVADRVVPAFQLDQLAGEQSALRVVRIDVVSPVSGVTEQDWDEHGTSDTASDDTLTTERFRFSRLGYVSTGVWSHCWLDETGRTVPIRENVRLRFAPDAQFIFVVLNTGKRGGCARGNTMAFTRGESKEVVAHELGHALLGLGDEYHDANETWPGGPVGSPNLSEQPADWGTLKWSALLSPGAPLPTSESSPPAGWNRRTSVGAFEGGGARFSTGLFRPVLECRMNSNNPPWCPVCGAHIATVVAPFR